MRQMGNRIGSPLQVFSAYATGRVFYGVKYKAARFSNALSPRPTRSLLRPSRGPHDNVDPRHDLLAALEGDAIEVSEGYRLKVF